MEDNPDRLMIERFIADNSGEPKIIMDSPIAVGMKAMLTAAEPGKVCISYDCGHEFTQGAGVLQGGAVATMLDLGLAYTGLSVSAPFQSVTTTTLTVNYCRPAPQGEYTVEAVVEKQGRTLIFGSAKLFNMDGKLIATASSPLAVIKLK